MKTAILKQVTIIACLTINTLAMASTTIVKRQIIVNQAPSTIYHETQYQQQIPSYSNTYTYRKTYSVPYTYQETQYEQPRVQHRPHSYRSNVSVCTQFNPLLSVCYESSHRRQLPPPPPPTRIIKRTKTRYIQF